MSCRVVVCFSVVLPSAEFAGKEKWTVDTTTLHPVFTECRVFKSAAELEVLRYTHIVSSEAHLAVMAHTRPGLYEYQLESLFKVRTPVVLESFTHTYCLQASVFESPVLTRKPRIAVRAQCPWRM